MNRNEIFNCYEKKINRAKSNIIGLKCDLYADMLADESGEMWDEVIDRLDEAEGALIKAVEELFRMREA